MRAPAKGTQAEALYQIIRRRAGSSHVASLDTAELSKELFGTSTRSSDVGTLLRKLESLGLMNIRLTSGQFESATVKDVPEYDETVAPPKVSGRGASKSEHSFQNFKTLRTLYQEAEREHPDWDEKALKAQTFAEFNRHHANGSWVYVVGRSNERPPYDSSYLTQWLRGIFQNEQRAVNLLESRPARAKRVDKPIPPDKSIRIVRQTNGNDDKQAEWNEQLVALLGPIWGKVESIETAVTKLVQAGRPERAGRSDDGEAITMIKDLILALYNGGDKAQKSAIGNVFGSIIRERNAVRRERESGS